MAATSRLESGGEAGAVHLSATCRQLVESRERGAQWAPGPGVEVRTGGAPGGGDSNLLGARKLRKCTGFPFRRDPCVQSIVARQPANVVQPNRVPQGKGGPLASFLYRL